MTALPNDDDATRPHVILTNGSLVGHYVIAERLGAGGMGDVYLAEDSKLNRKVALKFLSSALSDDKECRQRFLREAQAAARLDNPHIVQVYEVSEHAGRPFFVMQLVEGRPLSEFAKDELDINQVIELSIQISEGLRGAHELGITHRDIKPSNILVDSHGRARIVDFGLATVPDSDQLTRTGSTLGTIGFMSPEQIHGKEVDARSDLFSLGVVVYELLTGQSPFRRDNQAATLKAVIDDIPEPITTHREDVPENLQFVVGKLLEKNPEHRYQTATGVISDLKRMIEPSSGSVQIVAPKVKKKANPWTYLVAAISILIVVSMFIFWPGPSNEPAPLEEVTVSVVVEPFTNLSDPNDPKDLGATCADMLVQQLSRGDIRTVLFKRSSQDDHDTDADWIVKGTFHLEPGFAFSSQIVSGSDGATVATQQVDAKAGVSLDRAVGALATRLYTDLAPHVASHTGYSMSGLPITTNSVAALNHYLEGLEYTNRDKKDSARFAYFRAVREDSTFALAWYRLAFHRANMTEIREAINRAVDLSEDVSQSERVIILAREKCVREVPVPEEGQTLLLEYLKEHPEDTRARYGLASTYQAYIADTARAIEEHNRVLETDLSNRRSLSNLAYLYLHTGRSDEAKEVARRYLDAAPNEANPHDVMADIYSFERRPEEASREYEKALSLDPDFKCHSELCLSYLITHQFSSLDSLLKIMLKHREPSVRAHGRLFHAHLLAAQGKLREATSALRSMIDAEVLESGVSPQVREKMGHIAVMYEAMGYPDSANYHYREFFRKNQAKPVSMGMSVWGFIAGRAGDQHLADSLAESLYSHWEPYRDKKYAGSHPYRDFQLGLIEWGRGNLDTAAVLMQKGAYLRGKGFMDAFALSQIYLENGDIANGTIKLQEAMRTKDLSRGYMMTWAVWGHFCLGRAYEQTGWTDKAIEEYRAFLDIWKDADPDIKSVIDAKKRLEKLESGRS